jgi:hypothetical protein
MLCPSRKAIAVRACPSAGETSGGPVLTYQPKIFEASYSAHSELLIKERGSRCRVVVATSIHLWSRPRGSVE